MADKEQRRDATDGRDRPSADEADAEGHLGRRSTGDDEPDTRGHSAELRGGQPPRDEQR
jgi:hypothetical protein